MRKRARAHQIREPKQVETYPEIEERILQVQALLESGEPRSLEFLDPDESFLAADDVFKVVNELAREKDDATILPPGTTLAVVISSSLHPTWIRPDLWQPPGSNERQPRPHLHCGYLAHLQQMVSVPRFACAAPFCDVQQRGLVGSSLTIACVSAGAGTAR